MSGGGQSGVMGQASSNFPLTNPTGPMAHFPMPRSFSLVKILLASTIFRYPRALDGQIILPDPKRLSA